MGPHPIIVDVLAADRERLVQRELVRQALLRHEDLDLCDGLPPRNRPVIAVLAHAATALTRASLRRIRIVVLLYVLLLWDVAAAGPARPGAAAWESGAHAGGQAGLAAAAGCVSVLGPFTLEPSGDGVRFQPAAPWCALHC